jgi:hypothetical protein
MLVREMVSSAKFRREKSVKCRHSGDGSNVGKDRHQRLRVERKHTRMALNELVKQSESTCLGLTDSSPAQCLVKGKQPQQEA